MVLNLREEGEEPMAVVVVAVIELYLFLVIKVYGVHVFQPLHFHVTTRINNN